MTSLNLLEDSERAEWRWKNHAPLLLILLLALPAAGQTFTWSGGGGDDNFSTGANWVGGSSPGVGSGIRLDFTGGTRPTPFNNYTAWDDFGSWYLLPGATTPFTVTGNPIDLFSKIENSSSQLFTVGVSDIGAGANIEFNPVGGDLTIASSNVFLNAFSLNVWGDNVNNRTLNLDAVVQGSGGVTLNQKATAIFGRNNSYSGTTLIHAGTTLRVGTGGTLGTLGSGGVTDDGSLIFNRSDNITVGNTISGAGAVTKSGAGNLVLNGANSFSGGLTIQTGVVSGVAAAFGGNGRAVTIQSGGAVDIGAVNRSANVFDVTLAGTGVTGGGAVFNSGGAVYGNSGVRGVTLSANATVTVGGATAEGNRWDFLSTGTLNLGGFTLTKNGGGNLVIRSTPGTAGSISVGGGTVGFEDNFSGTATTNVSISVAAGAAVGAYNARTIDAPVTLNGSTAEIYTQGSLPSTWRGPVTLNSGGRINNGDRVYTGSDIYVSGNISGSGPLEVGGSSSRFVVLTGNNNHSGGTRVSGTYLRVASDSALGASPGLPNATNIVLQNDARLQAGTTGAGMNLTIDSNRGVSLPSGNGGFHPWGGFTIAYGGSITGPGSLTKTDGGTLLFTGSATHSGGTRLGGGTLTLSNNATINGTSYFGNNFSGTASTLNILDNASITTAGAGSYMVFGDQSAASITINQSGGSVNNAGTANNPGANDVANRWGHWGSATTIYNLSGGTLNLLGAPLYLSWDSGATLTITNTGVANIRGFNLGYSTRTQPSTIHLNNGGTLRVGIDGITTGGTANKSINLSGGTLGSLTNWSSSLGMNLTNTTTISPSNLHTITLTGTRSGPGGFIKADAGTLSLGGNASSHLGNVAVNGGTVIATAGNNGTNTVLGARDPARTISMNSGGTLLFTINNVFGGGGMTASVLPALVVNGGALATTRFNVIGNVTLNGGLLTNSSSDSGAYQAWQLIGNVTVGGSSPSFITTGNGRANHLRGGASTTFDVADATGNTASDLVVTAPIANGSGDYSGNSALIKTGAGTMELRAAGGHSTSTTVDGGTFAVDGDQESNRLNANHAVTVNNTGTFEIRGVNALPTSASAVDVTVNAGGTLRVQSGGSAAIGSGGQSHAHLRHIALNGGLVDLTYSGNGSAYDGESIGLNGDVTVGGSSMSTIQSSAAASVQGIALVNNRTFTVNDVTAGTDLLVTAELENNGLIKAGLGTLTLASANSYSGNTAINAGTLALGSGGSINSTPVINVAGSATYDVSAVSGYTLGAAQALSGNGTVTGAMSVNGTLAPGSSVGQLTTGAQTWNSGGTNVWELDDAAGTAGVSPGWDHLAIGGSLDVQATTGSKFNLTLKGAGFDGSVTNFNPDNTYAWPIATASGGVSNFDPAKFAINDTGFTNDLKGGVITVTNDTGDNTVKLRFTANQSPAAGLASYTRQKGVSLKIPITNLLAAFTSDADGDPRALVSLGTSTNGISVTANGTYLFYANTADVDDELTYTIRDVRTYRAGDTVRTASGTLRITVAGDTNQTQNIVSLDVSSGTATIRFAGIPGRDYLVQTTTNLSTPWWTLATNTAGTNGLWQFIDPNATNAMQYYRTTAH